jgi:hypothetical protein
MADAELQTSPKIKKNKASTLAFVEVSEIRDSVLIYSPHDAQWGLFHSLKSFQLSQST